MDRVSSRIPGLIAEQLRLERERQRLKGSESELHAGPPAAPEEIAAAEARLGFTFPPSYRAYLETHNGIMLFWPDWCLFGVSGADTEKMAAEAKEVAELASVGIDEEAEWEAPGEDPVEYREKIRAAQQQKRPREVYTPDHRIKEEKVYANDHVLIGTTFNGSVMVFDRFHADAHGENEVIEIDGTGEINNRWRSFEAMVEHAVETTKEDIQALGQPA